MPSITLARSPQRVIAPEFGRVERVERHVDALHAAACKLAGIAGKLRAVGRQRQFVERARCEMARQRAEQAS